MAWTDEQAERLYALEHGVYPDPDELADYLYPYHRNMFRYKEYNPGCYHIIKLPDAE